MADAPIAIPLLDAELLSKNLEALGKEAVVLLRQFASDYVVNNKDDALALGKEAVTAILIKEMYELAPIPPLPENPTMAQIAWREEYVSQRAQVFQLVAAAQRENSERVSRVTAAAKSTAFKIISAAFGLVFTAMLGA